MRQVPIKIIPKKATETISISSVSYINKFRKHFKRKDLIDFFVFGKTVVGKRVYLEIRSMRVNEFIMMLEDFGIKWQHVTERYK